MCSYVPVKEMNVIDVQWNPVNTVTNGPKKNLAIFTSDRINEGFLQENVWLFCRAAKKVAAITK